MSAKFAIKGVSLRPLRTLREIGFSSAANLPPFCSGDTCVARIPSRYDVDMLTLIPLADAATDFNPLAIFLIVFVAIILLILGVGAFIKNVHVGMREAESGKKQNRKAASFWSWSTSNRFWGWYGIWAELDELREEVDELKDEIARLKGEIPGPSSIDVAPDPNDEMPRPDPLRIARERAKALEAEAREADQQDQQTIVHIRCLDCDRVTAVTKALKSHLQNCPACGKYPFGYAPADEAEFLAQQKDLAAAPAAADEAAPTDPYRRKATSTYRNPDTKGRKADDEL